jgi:preprotein translocase subunit Sec63
MEYTYDSSGLYFSYFLMAMLSFWLFPVTWMYIKHMTQSKGI